MCRSGAPFFSATDKTLKKAIWSDTHSVHQLKFVFPRCFGKVPLAFIKWNCTRESPTVNNLVLAKTKGGAGWISGTISLDEGKESLAETSLKANFSWCTEWLSFLNYVFSASWRNSWKITESKGVICRDKPSLINEVFVMKTNDVVSEKGWNKDGERPLHTFSFLGGGGVINLKNVSLLTKHSYDFFLLEKQTAAQDCKALKNDGKTLSGEYFINLGGSWIKVYCNMSVDGGGWTVFQRRKDGSVDFYRNWENYENGFGDVTGDFWLGNKWIHRLTSLGVTELRVDFENGEFAKYSRFAVGDAAGEYTLTVSGFGSRHVHDGLDYHNNMKFTTYDKDHDRRVGENCAVKYKGAWWYQNCYTSNLNGVFGNQDNTGIRWGSIHTFSEMKLRRVWSKRWPDWLASCCQSESVGELSSSLHKRWQNARAVTSWQLVTTYKVFNWTSFNHWKDWWLHIFLPHCTFFTFPGLHWTLRHL